MADWKMNGTAGNVTDSSPPATATARGGVKLTNDLGGTADLPTVVATHLATPLPEAQGGTGAATLGAGLVTPTGGPTTRTIAAMAAEARGERARGAMSERIRQLDLTLAHAEPAQSPLSTPVPYIGTSLIHADVQFFAAGWNGYRYWMAITPYHNGENQYENPSIYCSHDGQTWVTPPGATNPVVPYPGLGASDYNADPDLVDGLDGRLYLFFKRELPTDTTIRVMYTEDGATWSTPQTIITTPFASGNLSPGVTFDGTTWRMYFVQLDTKAIRVRTATSPFGPWSDPVSVTIEAPPGAGWYWHLDAQIVAGRTVLLVQVAGAGVQSGLYFAWSDDGATFIRQQAPVLAPDNVTRAGGMWAQQVYRSGFAFIDSGTDTRIGIWYTGQLTATAWRLGYTEAFLRRDSVASVLAATNLSEWIGLRSKVVGGAYDAFRRPDSATGLGSLPSGHAWVKKNGTMGISNGQAYGTSVTNNSYVVAVASDVRVGVRFDVYGGGSLSFRYTDSTHFLRVTTTGVEGVDAQYIFQRVDGTATTVASGIARARSGDWVEVEALGSAISIKVNGLVVWSGVDTFNQSAVNVGIQLSDTAIRAGAFYAEPAGALIAPDTHRPPVVSSASAPPLATADFRGTIWVTRGGAGVADTVQVCAKDAADAYAWRTIY